MPCFSATAAGDTSTYVVQYCLNAGTWDAGQCCDITSTPTEGACAAAPQYADGAFTSEAAFCGTKANLSNKFLREFLMPQNTQYCPAYSVEQVSASQTTKVHEFKLEVPTTSAATWHCKYGISTSDFKPDGTATADMGYTYLIAENYCFDNNVIVIVQPRNKFLDFNFRSQTNNPEKMTKVFKSTFGRKYLIPAQYDIFLYFAPISFARGTDQTPINPGKF